MEKKRLLVVHPTIAPYRIDFFNDLSRNFEARICLEYWNLKDQTFDYAAIYRQFEFEPEYLPQGSVIKLLRRFLGIIREFRPEVVITSEYGAVTGFAILCKHLTGVKYRHVVISDDNYDMLANKHDFSKRHRFARSLLVPHIDEVILLESRARSYYIERFGKGLFFPLIVDEQKAIPRYGRILDISRKFVSAYDLKGKKVLLFVGRLVDLKNLHRALDAFGSSSAEAVFVIIGDGLQSEELKAHAAGINKRVLFPGRFEGDELYAWYNIASVFILPSYLESFGAVTNEALLAGCQVIVSRAAGSSCLVDETNGQLVDPYDVRQISEAIDAQLSRAPLPDLNNARHSKMVFRYSEQFRDLLNNLMS